MGNRIVGTLLIAYDHDRLKCCWLRLCTNFYGFSEEKEQHNQSITCSYGMYFIIFFYQTRPLWCDIILERNIASPHLVPFSSSSSHRDMMIFLQPHGLWFHYLQKKLKFRLLRFKWYIMAHNRDRGIVDS